ncbi:uncharacterized protein TOT_030000230 [Theileria orientalis strain Shintoku]|uniref:BOP1 N-terminal domain-containing protein n=1 Tax=Theileria orientalis strain Shintoku TaxID=869250 RepID=J4DPM6_THEOR|nr:uncharacterized protein TOT_030000230 [Theileria orientalis strain Shintoku]BAM40969.1 uncharacterized protein TOT_030000230 [Theileria orientalis strain Shintoku]|eukprot:XP_009691270.1 uncharacterized protein TOT_030000230 [Theileria orientalis strain Shintoku]
MPKKRFKNDNIGSELTLRKYDIETSSTRSNSVNDSKTRNKKNLNKTKVTFIEEDDQIDLQSQDSETLFDSDEAEGEVNRTGNVPIDWYNDENHIGYTVEGKRLVKELDSTQLGQLIFNSDNPDSWRTIVDPKNNRTIRLSDDDLKIIRRIRKGMYPSETYDAEGLTIEFDNKDAKQPVSFELEPKARFLPSKWEAMKVARLVKLIKSGKIFTLEQRRLNEQKMMEEWERVEDIWKDAIYDVDPTSAKRSSKNEIKPPKTELPTHSESYNPPEEYLFNEEEKKDWIETEPHERKMNYMPNKYESLRAVPVYENLIVERFTRCLQLLMCPRAVKMKMNVDPESLLPKLPSPSELGPFPKKESVEYRFEGLKKLTEYRTGRYVALATSEIVRICDVITGCAFMKLEFSEINDMLWHPKLPIIVVAHESKVTILPLNLPNKSGSKEENEEDEYEKARNYLSMGSDKNNWKVYKKGEYEGISIQHPHPVRNMAVHPGGNYIVCVSPESVESINQCVLHCIPKKSSMRLGNKISNNRIKLAMFHPSEPKLIVAFTRNIRLYNLSTTGSNDKLNDESKFTGVELPVSMDTNGTYLLTGDEEGKLTIYDQEISSFPYKTFSFENEKVIKVQIHKKLPLALVAYRKSIKCFHISTNKDGEILFVPLNELKMDGILSDCNWHNREPWLYTCTNKKGLLWMAKLISDYYNYDDEIEEKNRNFKSLLNKYQSLISEYHKQANESKVSIGILVNRAEKLNEENKKLQSENMYLKKRINYMANRMDSLECMIGDTRCMRGCNGRHNEYQKYDLKSTYPNVD